MKSGLLASLLLTMSGAGAEPAAQPAPALRVRLTNEVIASAVRETLAQDAPEAVPAPSGTVLSGGGLRSFAHDVAESRKPSCFGQDALKFQPAEVDTRYGRFEAKGLTAAPFWAAAILRGKCR